MRIPRLQSLYIAVLLTVSPLPVLAQAPGGTGYVADHWNTDTGLPQNSVNDIIQSRDGYLWIATHGGLARFDGSAFSIITSGSQRGLRSDRILTLAEDRAGNIWIGTETGLSRYTKGTFTHVTLAGIAEDAVTDIMAHPDGSVWFGTRTGVVTRLDPSGTHAMVVQRRVLHGPVFHIVVDSTKAVWVQSSSGLWRVDRSNPQGVTKVREGRRAQRGSLVEADAKRGLWVATDSGLIHFTENSEENYTIRHLLGDPAKMCKRGPDCGPWADGVDVNIMSVGGPNLIWLGTRAGEVWRFRPDSVGTPGMLRRVKASEPGSSNTLLVDREGNVWSGSDVSGLSRIRPALFHVYTTADGLINDVSTAVFTAADGRMWVGANCGGVSFQDGNRFKTIVKEDGLRHQCVWSLAQDTTGAMWTGTYGGGLGRYHNGRFTHWFQAKDGLPSSAVLALFRDRVGTIWIGTDNGLASWDGNSLAQHYGRNGNTRPRVRTIQQTRDGVLWIGAEDGLYKYTNGEFTAFTTTNGLPHNYIRAIYEAANGVLWLGTYGGGLVRMQNGKFNTFTTANGLFDNVVSSIIEDSAGNLWMSCNRGIFRVALSELEDFAAGRSTRVHSVVYGRSDGMLSSETNGGFEPAVSRTADGRLWYPTIRGVAVIDPAKAIANPVAPAVVIEHANVNGRPFQLRDENKIGPGSVDVEITYSGLSFTAPDAVTFRYRLENWDRDWIEAGTRRTAYYTRLKPGNYRFLVSAANRDGVWSPTHSALSFVVQPRLWQTWWFRTLAAIGLLVLAISAYRARMKQLKLTTEAAEREASRKRVTGILESITDGFLALDREWCFTYVNSTAEHLLGQPRERLLGHSFWEAFPRVAGTFVEESLRRVATERQPEVFEAPDTPSYGRWVEVHAYPAEEGVSVYFSDITTRKEAEATLRSQSLRDELTGLYNRRGFLALAEQQTVGTERSGRGFHIVFIDMDGMKTINDTLGHNMGDRALLDTVELMQHTFRKSDIMGRLGGDEFAVVMVESDDEHVEVMRERLLDQLRIHNATAGRPYTLALSIGVSKYEPSEPLPIAELIAIADERMYQAKRAKGAAR